jgi:hypothetical protein
MAYKEFTLFSYSGNDGVGVEGDALKIIRLQLSFQKHPSSSSRGAGKGIGKKKKT